MSTVEPLEVAALDLAGTTVEENGSVRAAVEHALRTVDAPFQADELHRLRGLPKDQMFRQLIGEPAQARAAYREFATSLVDSVRAGTMAAKPGAERVFVRLRDAGIRVALITGFAPDIRDQILDALGWTGTVDLTLSPEDAGRGRPYPDLIWAAAARLEATGVRSILVAGDTRNDLVAAARSGAGTTIGVLGGAHSRAELEQAPHTHIIDAIADLPGAIALD